MCDYLFVLLLFVCNCVFLLLRNNSWTTGLNMPVILLDSAAKYLLFLNINLFQYSEAY